jgi:YgiT-type zinc finger domain-containing protein
MICLICRQAEVSDGLTSVTFARDEFRLIVNGVPAQICSSCGEAYLEEKVVVKLLGIARQSAEGGILDMQCEFGAF